MTEPRTEPERGSRAMNWLLERPMSPPRIVTLVLWAMVVLTPIGVFYGFYRDANDDLRSAEVTRCEQRVEGRLGSRERALANIDYVSAVIDLIDQHVGISVSLRNELTALETAERALVDKQLPVITMAQCLEGYRTGAPTSIPVPTVT